MASVRLLIFLVLLLALRTAGAEVVDKMASIPQLWTTNGAIAVALAAIGFLAPRSLIGIALAFALALLFAWPPAVEPEFLPEALRYFGPEYEGHAQASQLLIPLGLVAGYALGWWRLRRRNAV